MRDIKALLNYDDTDDENVEYYLKQKVMVLRPEDYDKKCYRCGLHVVEDTPKALYRLLYLFGQPSMNFTKMYKEGLLWLVSPNGQFLVECYFSKYLLCLEYWVLNSNDINPKLESWQRWPYSFEQGTRCINPDGQSFFELVTSALESKWDIYNGTDFIV